LNDLPNVLIIARISQARDISERFFSNSQSGQPSRNVLKLSFALSGLELRMVKLPAPLEELLLQHLNDVRKVSRCLNGSLLRYTILASQKYHSEAMTLSKFITVIQKVQKACA
jgi:hypothetical protein